MKDSGNIRGMLSKKLSAEEFIIHVAKIMEKQLKEWDKNYDVFIMKLANYEFVVKNNEQYYETSITEGEIQNLQNQSPFSLDRKLWNDLQNKGLPLEEGDGDYWSLVF